MRKTFWMMSAGVMAIATPAAAQDNASNTGQVTATEAAGAVQPSDDLSEQDEIIITAQGRAQALQDVPVSVTAVSAEALQNSGATDIRQLNQLAPSLLVSSTGSEANGSARIRGIGTVGDNPGLESSVAVFIDGVYRSRSGIGLNELGEIERVEVLRGPQGTLFGRNASAGLINVVSKKPSFDTEGYGEISYGNYDAMRFAFGATGGISETAAARIDAVYSKRDGFLTDVVSGEKLNNRDRLFVRGQLLLDANPDTQIRLIGDYTYRDEACCAAVYASTAETFDSTPTQAGDFQTSPSNRIVQILQRLGGVLPSAGDPYNRQVAVTPGRTFANVTRDWGVSAQIDHDFGGANLTSISAYRQYKSGNAGDFDYGNVDITYRAADGKAFREFHTLSQELRLQGSAFEDKLDWLIGGYYAEEELNVVDNIKFGTQYGPFAACRAVAGTGATATAAAFLNPAAPGCINTAVIPTGAIPGVPAGTTFRQALAAQFGAASAVLLPALDRLSLVRDVGDQEAAYGQDSTNWAVFTHNIINFTDRLSLTLGARYTNEKKEFDASFQNNNTICPVQQAALGPLIANPATPAAIRTAAAGILTLTCTGNSSSSLNGLRLDDEIKEDQVTGTAVLSFKPTDDLMTYASYSKGYKSGGYNLDRSDLGDPVTGVFSPRTAADVVGLRFDAEKVDAFEIGLKYGARGLTFNVAGFRQDFSNFQLNTFQGSVFIVQNISSCDDDLNGADRDNDRATGRCTGEVGPGVRSQGVEIEAGYNRGPISVNAGYTYADTQYRNNLVGSESGEALDPALFLLPGSQVSNAPKHVVTGSFGYSPDIGGNGLKGLFYVDARYTSDYNTGSDLFPEKFQDSYTLVNARIGVRGETWSLEAWGQNIFNKDYQQVAFNAPYQGANSVAQVQAFNVPSAQQIFSTYLAEPRTYGVTLRSRF